DLFWSFRSPYSYLAVRSIQDMRQKYDLTVTVRPVYPIAVRTPKFFSDVNPLWIPYLLNDIERVGAMKNIPISWPRPDPVKVNRATGEIPKEQPYIHRLTHLGIAASEVGDGLDFVDCISNLLWNGEVRGWHEGDHLANAAAQKDFDLAALDAMIEDHFDDYAAKVEVNQQALEASGHWGVPTLAYKNEAFFGQDRVDVCLWRMLEDGLQERK
ncbi:MAG: 2-hydroxychromene-2-carboxylate isomerase, partial [Alphaproteobacteria bacterium]